MQAQITKFLGATTECRGTLDHLFYMCQNLLKNKAYHNRHYCDMLGHYSMNF